MALFDMGIDVLPVLAEALDDTTPTKTPHYARHVYPFREDRGFQVNEIVAVLICEIADREFDWRHEERMVSIREIGSYPKLTRRFKNQVIAWYVQNKEKRCPSGDQPNVAQPAQLDAGGRMDRRS